MDAALKILLPAYLLVFFCAALLWRTYIVWRKTGKNAYVLRKAEGAHGVIAFGFRLVAASAAAAVLIYSWAGSRYRYLAPIGWLEQPVLVAVGLGLLGLALVWVVVAQSQMGVSWRIGIDEENRTALVTGGVFRWSRNPIFLGIRAVLLSLFLVLPNALTLAVWALGDFLIRIQVCLEEEHLTAFHGADYENYRRRTRRWL